MGSISRHITPLVIHSLRGGHTHTHKSINIQTCVDRSNYKKPRRGLATAAPATGRYVPGKFTIALAFNTKLATLENLEFGLVKYWGMTFVSSNLSKFFPARILGYTITRILGYTILTASDLYLL